MLYCSRQELLQRVAWLSCMSPLTSHQLEANPALRTAIEVAQFFLSSALSSQHIPADQQHHCVVTVGLAALQVKGSKSLKGGVATAGRGRLMTAKLPRSPTKVLCCDGIQTWQSYAFCLFVGSRSVLRWSTLPSGIKIARCLCRLISGTLMSVCVTLAMPVRQLSCLVPSAHPCALCPLQTMLAE